MAAEQPDPHALINALQSAPSSVAVFNEHGGLIFHTHQLARDMPQIKEGLINFLDSLTKEHPTNAILEALEECAEVNFVARQQGDKRIWEIRMNGGPGQQITPVFIRDVSEREERDKINRILLELVENSLDPIGIGRADLHAFYVNPAMRKLFGAHDDTPVEQLRVEHLQPDYIGPYPLHDALRKAVEEGPFYTETTIVRPSDKVPVEVSQLLMAHRDPLDGSLYYSTAVRDISAARQLQTELNNARLELEKLLIARTDEWLKSTRQAEYAQRVWQSLVDKNADLIVLTTDDGEILYANQGFIASGGIKLIGSCIFDLIDPARQQQARQQFKHCMIENQGHFSFEAELRLADQSRYFCLFSVNYVPPKDAGHAATWMISDVTAEHKAREQLAISEQMAASGRMAARVAHEINNPLAAIQNSVSLIRMDIPSGSEAREYLDLMERELKRVANIIRQMYGLYRRQDEAPRKLALSHICEEVTKLLAAQASSRNILLEVKNGEEVFAEVTESSVRQVLYNVIINAMDASPNDSTVTIHLHQDGDSAIIDIVDQGKGITPADAARIFEPFYTTKETYSGQGLGLGLPVSASIIRGLGGEISLRAGQEKGTICQIILPVESKQPVKS